MSSSFCCTIYASVECIAARSRPRAPPVPLPRERDTWQLCISLRIPLKSLRSTIRRNKKSEGAHRTAQRDEEILINAHFSSFQNLIICPCRCSVFCTSIRLAERASGPLRLPEPERAAMTRVMRIREENASVSFVHAIYIAIVPRSVCLWPAQCSKCA